MKHRIKFQAIVCIVMFLCIAGCQNDEFYDPVPYVLVDVTINLNNQQFAPLRLNKGHVNILGGSRGIIIYRESASSYKAFERHSPHRSLEICAIVDVHPSDLYMTEACDGLSFDFNGNPLDGAPYQLRQYNTQLAGDFLYISSQ